MGLTYYCFKKGIRVFSLKNLIKCPHLVYRIGQSNWEYAMWKYQDIPAAQILRESNFGDFKA